MANNLAGARQLPRGIPPFASTDSSRQEAPCEGPQQALERAMLRVWPRVLRRAANDGKLASVSIDGDLKSVLLIIQGVEREVGIELPISMFCGRGTLGEIVEAIRTGAWAETPRATVLRRGNRRLPVLFLIPGAGSAAVELATLGAEIAYEGPVCALHADGLFPAESKAGSVEEMGRCALATIKMLQSEGPYLLFGYSFGGCIAVETARIMRDRGDEVAFLGLGESPLHPRSWPAGLLARDLAARFYQELKGRKLAKVPGEFGLADRTTLPSSGGKPPRRIKDVLLRLHASIAKRLRNVFGDPRKPGYVETSPYFAGGYPKRFQTARDRGVIAFALYAPRRLDLPAIYYQTTTGDTLMCDPRSVWPRVLPNLRWRAIGGDHASMMRPPYVHELAAQISAHIDETAVRPRYPASEPDPVVVV